MLILFGNKDINFKLYLLIIINENISEPYYNINDKTNKKQQKIYLTKGKNLVGDNLMGNQLEKLRQVSKTEELKYLQMSNKQKKKEKKRGRRERKTEIIKIRDRRFKLLNRFFELIKFEFSKIFLKIQKNKIIDYSNLTYESFLSVFGLTDDEK